MDNKPPNLVKVIHQYQQEEDSNGRSGHDLQSIEVTAEWVGEGFYYTIQTERWAIDTPEEILPLIKAVEKSVTP